MINIDSIKNSELSDCFSINTMALEDTGMSNEEISELSSDAIVIFCDFGDVLEVPNEEEYVKKIEVELSKLNSEMKDKGYELVNELDGSGGGLIYMLLVFDKV